MPAPKVMTFDVVGTLIDFETGMVEFLKSAAGPGGEAPDGEAILAAYRDARMHPDAGRVPDDLARVYRQIAPALGLAQDEAVARRFVQASSTWPAFPDTVEALRRLKTHCKLVAMTNTQRWSFDLMVQTLGNPFDDSVTVDEAQCDKPDPRFFAFARGRLSRDGHGLHDILHVAQSQYHDIGAARALGYTVCWIERRQGKAGPGGTLHAAHTVPDYHFPTLAALADAMDAGTVQIPGASGPSGPC